RSCEEGGVGAWLGGCRFHDNNDGGVPANRVRGRSGFRLVYAYGVDRHVLAVRIHGGCADNRPDAVLQIALRKVGASAVEQQRLQQVVPEAGRSISSCFEVGAWPPEDGGVRYISALY